MIDVYRKSYSDICYILSALDEEYIKLIPSKLIDFFKENSDEQYISTIDLSKPLIEQNISEETEQLICLLNLNYWCTSEEKEILLKKYKINEEMQKIIQMQAKIEVEDNLNNAYAEVEQVLDFLGDSYKQKIPEKLIKLFKEKKNKNHKIQIDKNTKLENIKLCRTTIIILSVLNLKYWEANPNKKDKLEQIYQKNEDKYQQKINEYKQDDWLKNRKRDKDKIENNIETSLIEIKKYSIIDKIKMFFKNLFCKKK